MSGTIEIGIAANPATGSDCGCCAGTFDAAPAAHDNPPGLAGLSYRIGTHASFKRAMLARLSSPDFTALPGLRTRADDDFTIALLDAWALAADVLTFYQERIVNESSIATAQEPVSVTALSALIGYRPGLGVAASVDLAYTLETAPGAPDQAVAATTIPPASRVQSVPGPGQTAQTFETIEKLEARVAWNSLRPHQAVPFRPRRYDTVLYLRAGSNARPGDVLLLVGRERLFTPGDAHWDIRKVVAVATDAAAGRMAVTLDAGLGNSAASADVPAVFILRTRAALFAANAPHPDSLADQVRLHYANSITSWGNTPGDWKYAIAGNTITLDNVYPAIAAQGWLVLAVPGATALFNVSSAAETGAAMFTVSGRATQVELDASAAGFGGSYRAVMAYAGSEALELADAPATGPVRDDAVALTGPADGLPDGRRMIVRGKRAVMLAEYELTLTNDDTPPVTLAVAAGTRLEVMAPPVPIVDAGRRWVLRAPGGFVGGLNLWHIPPFVPAAADAETLAEPATLLRQEIADRTRATLLFSAPLAQVYDRASLEVLGNVARATHGESVGEILGSGDPSLSGQRFTLAQMPLTTTRARVGRGSASTLQVRVGGVLWQEVPNLLGSAPRDRVYTTSTGSDGRVSVQFGDGVEGARPPAGQNNLQASYRKGTGLAGMVPSGALTLLTSRPLGVKAVVNALPADGGQDPELPAQTAVNAPASVLTLDRVVSLSDVEDFARAFAGVAKAQASVVWTGGARRIFATVAGPGGASLSQDGLDALLAAIHGASEPSLSLALGDYRPVTFRLHMRVAVDPAYVSDDVLAAVRTALLAAFGFDAIAFAQPIALSAVVAVAVAVPSVLGAQVVRLARDIPPDDSIAAHARLRAAGAERLDNGAVHGAELLTIEPTPTLEVMP